MNKQDNGNLKLAGLLGRQQEHFNSDHCGSDQDSGTILAGFPRIAAEGKGPRGLRHLRLLRHPIVTALQLISVAAIGLSCPAAQAQKDFGSITEIDKRTMPLLCRLILIDKPSAHLGSGQIENAALFEKPEYRMAKGNIHVHHYCYAFLDKNRYFSSSDPAKKSFFLHVFMGEIDYVLNASPKEWEFFHQLYYEQAEMYFLANDLPKALQKANEALKHRPDFDKAHALMSDTYLKLGKRGEAIQQLQIGLKASPASLRLIRRLKEINPKDPLLAAPIETTKATSQEKDSPKEEKYAGPAVPERIPPTTSEDSKPDRLETKESKASNSVPSGVEATPTVQPNGNPYCRFCPP